MAEDTPKYLRSKTDGHLFPYTEDLANHPDLEPVGEEDAYPERNMPEHVKEKAAEDEGKDDLDLAKGVTPEAAAAEKPKPTDPALAKQAAKGFPK